MKLLWQLPEQMPAVEAYALFICAVQRRSERIINFESEYSQSTLLQGIRLPEDNLPEAIKRQCRVT
ncbi:hypothetical protein KL86DES1_22133 [uncultured Desulfovibrio sp.]|uniref:Uncharacterized protein n=1 Tax=uncultured Desulfovibrio sp. TaxID=167968 RepID=A0A212LB05_9BACT|nr:hypothetical protein KL86DES1_22133 [uncultured Desulfovibrio sp.]VZH35027.1 conserved protein of unknown function [Desulfovibrio sp. 86]